MEATPLEMVSASDMKQAKQDFEDNCLINTLKACLTSAKQLGQYPVVWNHEIDDACKKELESNGYAFDQVDTYQYLLYDKTDKKEE